LIFVADALGDVDMTKSWRQEKNASAFFETQETALPERKNWLKKNQKNSDKSFCSSKF
jgi:hypothetical protein